MAHTADASAAADEGPDRWDALPLPACEIGADGLLRGANRAFVALGLSAATQPQAGAARLPVQALPVPAGAAHEALISALATRADFHQALMLHDSSGAAYWFDMVARWQPDRSCYLALLHDITAGRRLQLQAQAELQRYALLANSVPALIAYYESTGFTCRYANRQYAATFGYTPESIVGHTYAEVVGESAGKMIASQVETILRDKCTASYERQLTDPNGATRWIEVSLVPHLGAGDQVVGAFVLISDITRHHLAEAALRESEDRMAKFMEASAEGIVFHRDGVITDVNGPMQALVGGDRGSIVGRRILDFVAPGHIERVAEVMATRADITYEIELLAADGQNIPVEVIGRTITRRGEPLRMAVVRDIRDRLAAQARIHHLAHHDALTGLPNRLSFMQRLEQALDSRRGSDSGHLALLFIDLDHFKRINDSLGHLEGDIVLRTVAERIGATLRTSDMVGRFGGDEFMVLLPEVADRQAVEEVAHKLMAAISVPVTVQRQSIAVTPSIGVAMYPRDGQTPAQLVKHADTAMYVAKATGRAGCRFFESAMATQAYAAIVLEGQLAQALQQQQLVLMLQPRVSVADGALAGVQALMRWRHPQRGMLAPESFTEVALERHLMQPIAEWALREVQQLQSRWREQGRAPIATSLDLAALPLALGDVVAGVEQVWSDAVAPPTDLGLDLGERMLGEQPHEARRLLGHLRALGVQVAIDDFGVGIVSLAQLKALPVHGLTIGRAFVSALPRDPAASTIARAIIGLARGLGLAVTAIGVETEAQRQWLAAEGCTLMQGPLVALPMPVPAYEDWLRERSLSRSAS